MGLREILAERSQPLLEPGEQIEVVFLAQTASQWTMFVPVMFFLKNRNRIVAVTDRAVVVIASSRLLSSKPVGVKARLPRSTPLGTPKGIWARLELDGERMYVHKRFHKDMAETGGPGGPAAA